MGQPQMQFSSQGFPPGLGGAVPAMTGDTVPNGGYAGMPPQQPQQPQAPVAAHQGQWSMNQVIQEKCV